MKIMDREETSVEAQLREVKPNKLWTWHQKLISYLCVYGTWSPVYTLRSFWCVSQCWSWKNVYLLSKVRWILITSDSWKSVQGDSVSGQWNELTVQSDTRPVISKDALNFVNWGKMLTEKASSVFVCCGFVPWQLLAEDTSKAERVDKLATIIYDEQEGREDWKSGAVG